MANTQIGASVQAPVNAGVCTESSVVWPTHTVPDLISYWSSQLANNQRGGTNCMCPLDTEEGRQHLEDSFENNDILLDEYFLLTLDSEPTTSEANRLPENDANSRTIEAESIAGCFPFTRGPYAHQYIGDQNTVGLSLNIDRIVWKKGTRPKRKVIPSLPGTSRTDSEHPFTGIVCRETSSRRLLLQFQHIKYRTFPFKRRMEVERASDDSIGSDEDEAILRAYQGGTSSRVSSVIPPQDSDGDDDGHAELPRPGRRSSLLLGTAESDSQYLKVHGKTGKMDRRMDLFSRSSQITTSGKHMPNRRHSIASTDVEHLAEIFASLKSRPDKLPDIGEAVLVLEEDEDPTPTSAGDMELGAQPEQPHRPNNFAKGETKGKVSDRFEVGGSTRKHSRLRAGGRRASIDVGTLQMPGSGSHDPHFTREILHQNIINMACSRESINEEPAEEDESNISLLRSRRLSISNTTTAPLLPLRSTHSRKGSVEDDTKVSGGRRQRRSSWACASMYQGDRRGSRATLMNLSSFQDTKDAETGLEMKDPYRLTVHYISDPNQSKKLRSLLRPLTQSVATNLKLFNYVDRSEPLILEYRDPDIMAIPSLAVMVFLQEEKGIERILKTQQYLKEDPPWQMHHRDLGVGGGVVPYPTNNQDFYSHAEGMPLWAVRQILGKDRLRFMIFVSHDNWGEMMSFYSNVLDRDVQFKKEDFCYFAAFACQKLNLEVQLALKRLPPDFVPTPLDAAILQFKVDDMDKLLPLLPGECSPTSEVRWQTTDPDGNRVLLLVQAQTSVKPKRDPEETDENGNQSNLDSAFDRDIPAGYV